MDSTATRSCKTYIYIYDLVSPVPLSSITEAGEEGRAIAMTN